MFKFSRLIAISILILLPIFFVEFSFAAQDKFYLLTLSYDNGSIKLKSINVFPGIISQANQGGNYRAELISFSNTSLYRTNFDVQTSIHGEDFDPVTGKITAKEVKLDVFEYILNIPYFPNGKGIGIYDPQDKKILTIPVGHFAEVSPTPISSTPPIVVTKAEKGSTLLYIGLGGLASGIALAVYLFRQSRRKDSQM